MENPKPLNAMLLSEYAGYESCFVLHCSQCVLLTLRIQIQYCTLLQTRVCQVVTSRCSYLSDFRHSIGTPAATSGDILGRYVGGSDPLTCINLVKEWWLSCEGRPTYHSRCSRTLSGGQIVSPDNTPLPRRCIHVTPVRADVDDPSDSGLEFRLEKTAGGCGQYICLSHRWVQPDTRQSSTTKSNYQARLSGDGFDQLPPLFIHTFRTAAKFGIRYVWIDSLCIIQDNADDWNQESGKMGSYYQFATFTLMSTFSPRDTASFDGYSPPTLPSMARLPYFDKTGVQSGYFYVYPRTSRSLLAKQWTGHMTTSGLLTRGWIFQEWLLSRRIVCLTPSGVYVQCQCRHPAATQNHLGEDVGSFLPRRCRGFLSIKASLRLRFESISDLYCSWEVVVENYSALTFSEPEKDRITALAGVVGEFAEALKSFPCRKTPSSNFIAGLWTGDLPRGLLWSQACSGKHKRLDGFPTWSRASIDAAVRWPSRNFNGIDRVFFAVVESAILGVDPDKLTEWKRTPTTTGVSLRVATGNSHPSLSSLIPRSAAILGALASNGAIVAAAGTNIGKRYNNILDLRGRMQPVFIGRLIAAKVTAGQTQTSARLQRSYEYRIVSIPNTQPLVSGWASVEHPDFKDDGTFSSSSASPSPPGSDARPPSTLLFALLISTQDTKKPVRARENGQSLELATPIGTEFNVLYLRSCPAEARVVNGYERIGMGRLFGKHAKRGFDLATERQVQLV